MAFRSLILIGLAASVLIVTCAADRTKTSTSSSSRAYSSYSSSETSISKKCTNVKRCPKNEEFSHCTQSIGRAQFCSQKGLSLREQDDHPTCSEGCVCKRKFLRNYNGTCIHEGDCDNTNCGPDEVLDDCPVDCASDYCPTTDKKTLNCIRPDKDQCPAPVCKCGFNRRRAENGTCISTRDCPPLDCSARPNEEYVACPPLCPSDDCSQASETGECPRQFGNILIVLPCNPTCRCIKGYWRKDGICVPYADCPNICPANEEYVPCIQGVCRAMNCSQKGEPIPCPDRQWPEEQCDAGCICKENYLRSENGTCVPEDQCETCGDNEILDNCPSDCASDYCPKCAEDNKKCPQPNPCPPPACKCAFNYRRSKNGTCIPTEDCPPFNCNAKRNEQWTPCPPLCPSDECSLARVTGICPFKIGIRLECNPKCQCKANYGRVNNTCVPFEDCPGLCPVNEEYNSCTQAVCRSQNCAVRDGPVYCPRLDTATCKKGCVCKKNYYRNSNGTCVTADECDTKPTPTCGDNEILTDCPTDCASDYCPKCEEDNKKCPQPNPCPPPACKCAFNYRRAKNGTCIPTEKCPPFNCSAKRNEQWTPCPPLCPSDECSLARVTGVCPFKIGIRLECNPKCQCKANYGRVNNTCVPFADCPGLCPVNEEYNSCTQAVCRTQNCTDRDGPVYCPRLDTATCKKGCVCKENYYRNSNGTCVTADKCDNTEPTPTCGDNEILTDCPSDCASDYCPKCEEDNKKCLQPNPCPPPACKCAFNYRRAKNGTCIPTEKCPPFNCSAKRNEEWTPCPPLCPSDECSLARVTGICPFKIGIRLECNPKCQCKANYGRVNNTCVPFEDCPGLCPVNEEYNSCTQAVCRTQNCTDRDGPVYCPRLDTATCKKGCVCKENYYRNSNGTCVTADKCDNTEPTPTCGDNEILTDCPSDCASDYCPKCEEDNKKCPKPNPCPPPACKCAFNYRRAKNGTCIPTEKCPPFNCSAKPNEIWTPCPPLCPSDACALPRLRGRCPFRIGIRLECNPKCQCKNGYGRVNGTCLPFEDCPNLCPINEEYNSCTQALCRPQKCTNRYNDPQPCPLVDSASCKRDCVCKQDYFRNDNGTCVTDDECIDKQCPNPNEKYAKSLVPKCPLLGTCMSIVARIRCEEPESLGCICKSGYLRAGNQTSPCIPTCQCPQMASAPQCQQTDS